MRLDLSGTSFTSGEMELYLRTSATEQDTVMKLCKIAIFSSE